MRKVEVTLNNFLFNSGVLGFYRIIKHVGKEDLVKANGNVLQIEPKAFDNFEKDYIKTMLDTFGSDTRWYTITKDREKIESLDMTNEEDIKELEELYKAVKKALESNSYKAGFEIVKQVDIENPYEYIETIKKSNDPKVTKEYLIKIIDHLKKYQDTYCMKDIMYNKINMFWDGRSFFYRDNTKKNIEGEYKNAFVLPVQEYLEKQKKSEYNCIECTSEVSKTEASFMSWLKDVGVDSKKKNSGFWDFKEDAFLCPVCNLIYSCVPLGFYIVGKESIFINQNNSIEFLEEENEQIKKHMKNEENNLENIGHAAFKTILNTFKDLTNEKFVKNEMQNIQVIKRTVSNDKVIHELSTISKEKLRIFKNSIKSFEYLLGKFAYINGDYINIYEEVMSNFLNNRNQFTLMYKLVKEDANNQISTNYKRYILDIQINSIGGIEMVEKEELKYARRELLKAGESLKKEYFARKENANKLRAYILQLTNSLRTNNSDLFMEIMTRMYGSLGKEIPCANAFRKMLDDSKYFRSLGYAYIIGLEAYVGEIDKGNKEDNKNEE